MAHRLFRSALVALFAVGTLGLVACGVDLEHGLDERQANQIASVLEQHGIAADKLHDDGDGTAGAWKIAVPRGELGRAFAILEDNDLPRRDRVAATDDHSLLPSLGEEQARLEAARAAELEKTLERVPGVVSARVHLALPDAARLDGVHEAARAAVLLRTSGALSVDDRALRRLVAGAVSGLSDDAVTLVVAGAAAPQASSLLEPVGPLRVARGERGRVITIAASGLALLIALGTMLIVTALRRQSAASNRNG